MKIFLFRHGKVRNPDEVLYGCLPNFHLSKEDRADVRKTSKYLKNENIKKIYSSPMERAQETSLIIAEVLNLSKKNIKIINDLTEANVMNWEGRKLTDFQNSEHRKNPRVTTDVEGMESSGCRVVNFLKEVVKFNENIVVVSHGDPIMGAVGLLSDKWDKTTGKYYIEKGNFIEIEITNDIWKVIR